MEELLIPRPINEIWKEFYGGWDDILSINDYYRPVIGEEIDSCYEKFGPDTIKHIYAFNVDKYNLEWKMTGRLTNGLYFYFYSTQSGSGFDISGIFDIYLTSTFENMVDRAIPQCTILKK